MTLQVDALGVHHPIKLEATPTESDVGWVDSPVNLFLTANQDHLALSEMYEWLGMLFLSSPRARKDDDIDSYLSSYCTPDFGAVNNNGRGHGEDVDDPHPVMSDDRDTMDPTGASAGASAEARSGPVNVSMTDCRVSKLRWHGFIPAAFVERMLLGVLRLMAAKTQQHWVCMNVSCFGGANYTIFVSTGGRDCFTWHCP